MSDITAFSFTLIALAVGVVLGFAKEISSYGDSHTQIQDIHQQVQKRNGQLIGAIVAVAVGSLIFFLHGPRSLLGNILWIAVSVAGGALVYFAIIIKRLATKMDEIPDIDPTASPLTPSPPPNVDDHIKEILNRNKKQ